MRGFRTYCSTSLAASAPKNVGPKRIQPDVGASAALIAKALFELLRLIFCAAAAWTFAGGHKEYAGSDEDDSDHFGGLCVEDVDIKNVSAFA
ncbi:hypothetical protein NBRC116589_16480 [Ruegeria sp. HU-ET01832]